ncbi:GRAA protein, partial [Horornis vulcanius]|nr:GRAA protein [Horornis vulcanius]
HQTEIMGAFLHWDIFVAVILLALHGGLCADIIGGYEVKPHSRPFMAQINGPRGIIENWVLTAAHCKAEKSKVVLGAHSLKRKEKEQQTFQIAKTLPHNTYFPYLLQLRGRAKLNKAVQPIHLPTSGDDPKPGTVCTVAGWGTTTREICNDKHHYNGKPVITENMICAGSKNGGKDSCN